MSASNRLSRPLRTVLTLPTLAALLAPVSAQTLTQRDGLIALGGSLGRSLCLPATAGVFGPTVSGGAPITADLERLTARLASTPR